MYKLVVETESLDELYNVVSGLKAKLTVVMSEVTAEPVKKERKKKLDIGDTLTEAEKESFKKTEKTPDAVEESELSYADVSKATMALVKAPGKGKPVALNILKEFGAANATELKQENWAKYIERVKEELAA